MTDLRQPIPHMEAAMPKRRTPRSRQPARCAAERVAVAGRTWGLPVLRGRSATSLLVVALFAIIAASPALASGGKAPLQFVPYAFETERHGTIDAEVAFLDVPARRAMPEGRSIRLRVVRIPATGGDGKAAPVVYLAGGPGGSGVGTARGDRWPVFDRVRRETDVLLFDQRGTGLSEPPPPCPHVHHFDDARPLQRNTALDALRRTLASCVAHWRAGGVDLAAYNSAESADDIEALRRSLGVPRVSLWGMSYGTHLALASLRRHPAGIERMVLLGTEGPDDTLKTPLASDALLEELAVLARKDGFEDVVGSARRVLGALRRQPAMTRTLTSGFKRVSIGEYDAQLAIAAGLGRRSTQQFLPLALREAERGDYSLLAELAAAVRKELGEFRAMPLATDAASGFSPARRTLVEAQVLESLFSDAVNFPFLEIAEDLGIADLGEQYRAPLSSDVPVLFVSGTLDGRTPPENAAALLPGFSQGKHLLIRNASHDDELWLGDPEIAERIAAFLGGRSVSDAEIAVAPPEFFTRKMQLLLAAIEMPPGAAFATAYVLAASIFSVGVFRWKSRRSRSRRLGLSPEGRA